MRYMILTGFLLTGCGVGLTSGQDDSAAQAGPDTCNAAAHQALVGRDAAASLALPEPKRLVGPADAVTTDYVASRLNVQLDDTDVITGITCG